MATSNFKYRQASLTVFTYLFDSPIHLVYHYYNEYFDLINRTVVAVCPCPVDLAKIEIQTQTPLLAYLDCHE